MARKRTGISGPYKHGKRWRVVCQKDGAREVLSFERLEEAQAFVDEWNCAAQGESVSVALDRWITLLERDDPAESTLLARRGQIARLIPHLPPTMEAVTPRAAQAAYDALCAGYAVDTHQQSLKAARQMWRDLYGKASPNPWSEVAPVGRRTKGKTQLTIDESRAFLASALTIGKYQRGGVAAALCLCLALRSGEIVALRGRDIDDGGRLLWVQRGKTESARRCLEVPEVLRSPLLELARRAGFAGRLFPYDRRWVYYFVDQVCEAANVTRVCPHGLRGTHATIARSAGATGEIVASALGHSNPTVTREHYIAPGTEERLGTNLVMQGIVTRKPAARARN